MTTLQLRPHQIECLDISKGQNTIVCLPTGCGKTLIAARLVQYYLNSFPEKRVAFLVPTRPLVEQQARYCEAHCTVSSSPPVVQRVVGEDQASWRQIEWSECLRNTHVLLGTAANFQKVFVTDKYLSVNQFSLFVFDECHNCVGNSPMAALMRDAIAPHVTNGGIPPRILGLTASFVNGTLKNLQKKRQALESLMLSTIFSPSVPPRLELENFTEVQCVRNPELDRHIEAIDIHVKEAISRIGPVKEVKKVTSRCVHVFSELGSLSLFHYIEKVIVQQILHKIRHLEDMRDSASMSLAWRMRSGIPTLREELQVLSQNLQSCVVPRHNSVERSSKLEQLFELLNDNFGASTYNGYRGIVFVEQVALVLPLAKQINDFFGSRIQCGAVAGIGAQSESDREAQLASFKLGDTHILVATATLEEGIDVSECTVVVRFSNISTTKAHIQGSGRARHPDAKVFYFENSPGIEWQNEQHMNNVAKDTSLQLSQQQLHQSGIQMNTSVNCHPYPFGSRSSITSCDGEVSVFNCKQIYNQYCSVAFGQSISPKKELYDYSYDSVSQRKKLIEVKYPSPNGWREISENDYKAFWSGVQMDEVFDPARSKRKTTSEKEEMCFVYIVVVKLRQEGFLDLHNKPNGDLELRHQMRRNCPLRTLPEAGINLKSSLFNGFHFA